MMADELTPKPALEGDTGAIGSPAFRWADQFTAREEGGVTANDGTGHAAAYGIDQSAHPEIDVSKLTPSGAQRIRYGYWTAVNGDALAQQNPGLALAAYDTAIMAGPERAKQLLVQSNGDPNSFLALRRNFLEYLVQSDPARYGPVQKGWAIRDQRLAQTVGGGAGGVGGVGGSYPWAGDDFRLARIPQRQPGFLESVVDDAQKQQAAPPVSGAPTVAAAEQTPPPPIVAPQLPKPTVQPMRPLPAPTPMEHYLAMLKIKPQDQASG